MASKQKEKNQNNDLKNAKFLQLFSEQHLSNNSVIYPAFHTV